MKKTNEKETITMLNKLYKDISDEINLSAILNYIYTKRISEEIILSKTTNQLNSIQVSIDKINPKFRQNQKNYAQIQDDIDNILNDFKVILDKIAYTYDKKVFEIILKKAELEYKLMYFFVLNEYLLNMSHNESNEKNSIIQGINNTINKIKGKIVKNEQIDVSLINSLDDQNDVKKEIVLDSEEYIQNQKKIKKIQKEIRILSQNIKRLNSEKEEELFSCLEVGEKKLSTEIRKPRTFTKITKFFTNRFNTYNVIKKNVITPLEVRIDLFKKNEFKKYDVQIEELSMEDFKEKIEEYKEKILNNKNNLNRCTILGINK